MHVQCPSATGGDTHGRRSPAGKRAVSTGGCTCTRAPCGPRERARAAAGLLPGYRRGRTGSSGTPCDGPGSGEGCMPAAAAPARISTLHAGRPAVVFCMSTVHAVVGWVHGVEMRGRCILFIAAPLALCHAGRSEECVEMITAAVPSEPAQDLLCHCACCKNCTSPHSRTSNFHQVDGRGRVQVE